MGKSKLVMLTIHKVYNDKTKSSRIDIVPLGVYRSYNMRLIENIECGISRLLKSEEEVLNTIYKNPDKWRSIYFEVIKYFDSDNGYGDSYVSIFNIKEYKEIIIQISVINLDVCEYTTLSYWMDNPKPNIDYDKIQKRYELPKVKQNNTHYTN